LSDSQKVLQERKHRHEYNRQLCGISPFKFERSVLDSGPTTRCPVSLSISREREGRILYRVEGMKLLRHIRRTYSANNPFIGLNHPSFQPQIEI
jgi:hypothetical protein